MLGSASRYILRSFRDPRMQPKHSASWFSKSNLAVQPTWRHSCLAIFCSGQKKNPSRKSKIWLPLFMAAVHGFCVSNFFAAIIPKSAE
jgi:hypothetical protein